MRKGTRPNLALALALIVTLSILSSPACIYKTRGQVTPWEKVTTYNAVLGQSIQTVTQGLIAVQQSKLLTVDQAKPVLTYMANASSIQKQINTVLAQAPSATGLAQIQPLITQIASGAQALVNNGALGVKNPQSQQTFSADIQLIVSTANSILAAYQTAISGGAQ